MQLVACLWIASCLISPSAGGSPRSVEDAEAVQDHRSPSRADTDFCNPVPCKNGGSCLKFSKKCSCPSGYSGVYCEVCKCENGFCKDVGKGNSVCACPPEWGLHSATKCKECGCGVDSNCTFEVGWLSENKTCLCKAGYEDKNGICVGTCRENPCFNGGQCTVRGKYVECKCKRQFTGERCEQKVSCSNDEDCYHGGSCEESGGAMSCRCPEGTFGRFCEGILGCERCGPSATCVYDAENRNATCDCNNATLEFDYVTGICRDVCGLEENIAKCDGLNRVCETDEGQPGGFRCVCRKGEIEDAEGKCVDVCSPNPCRNGGICNSTGDGAICRCRDGFRAADCSIDVCSPNPCRNGGVCDVTQRGAFCHCRGRFTGSDCSIETPATTTSLPTTDSTFLSTRFPTTTEDPCTARPCQNGGTCVVEGGRPKCFCKRPYLGTRCETDPCDWNPCLNGGVCKIEYGAARCFCRDPFAGEFCGSRMRTDAYLVILVGASVFLAVLLTLVACILCQRYHVTRTSADSI